MLIGVVVVALARAGPAGDPRAPGAPRRSVLRHAGRRAGEGVELSAARCIPGVGLGLVARACATGRGQPGADGLLALLLRARRRHALLVGGLVAEHLCTFPPDDDDPTGTAGRGSRVALMP